MAYARFKELTKYFDFKHEVDIRELPFYATEYVNSGEKILLAYKTSRDYAVFTDKTMIMCGQSIHQASVSSRQ